MQRAVLATDTVDSPTVTGLVAVVHIDVLFCHVSCNILMSYRTESWYLLFHACLATIPLARWLSVARNSERCPIGRNSKQDVT